MKHSEKTTKTNTNNSGNSGISEEVAHEAIIRTLSDSDHPITIHPEDFNRLRSQVRGVMDTFSLRTPHLGMSI